MHFDVRALPSPDMLSTYGICDVAARYACLCIRSICCVVKREGIMGRDNARERTREKTSVCVCVSEREERKMEREKEIEGERERVCVCAVGTVTRH